MTQAFNLSQFANKLNTSGQASLTTGVTGTLPIGNGGTGQTTANAALNALLPSQTSQSGKYLQTNGTNTSWITPPVYAGGAISTSASDITLTSTSNQMQQIEFTAIGKKVILPLTSAMSNLSGVVFVIQNDGEYPFDIALASGVRQYSLSAGESCVIGLVSSSGERGWVFGNATPFVGLFPATQFSTTVTNTNISLQEGQIVAHSNSQIVFAYAGAGSDTYLLPGTVSSGIITWGTPVLTRAGSVANASFIVALSSSVGCVLYNASASFVPVFYSISGGVITLAPEGTSTGATATFLVALDSTRVVTGYSAGTKVYSYNGTGAAPTMGGAIAQTAAYDSYSSRAVLIDTDKYLYLSVVAATPANLNARVVTTVGAPPAAPVQAGTATLTNGNPFANTTAVGWAYQPQNNIWVYSTSEVALLTFSPSLSSFYGGTYIELNQGIIASSRITISANTPSLAGVFYSGGFANSPAVSFVQFSATDGVVIYLNGSIQRVYYASGIGLQPAGAPYRPSNGSDNGQLNLQTTVASKVFGSTTRFVMGNINTNFFLNSSFPAPAQYAAIGEITN
jgi:hypothetical protein